jgi:hypothetical protein
MTVQANFAALCEEGALNSSRVRNRLPGTIRDSMLLSTLLGQKYIWIDRLCIIQDDDKPRSTQLGDMASIYVNAFLTIVAANGEDDTFEIRGIIAGGLSRTSPFHQFDFAPTCRLITDHSLVETKYDTRG